MESKLATATASEVGRASNAHYQVDQEIMDHVRNMSLQGKRKLADKMPFHAADAEKEAKTK
jgi:hypothetical protein